MILANRVTPLTGPDLKLFKDALEVASHYLTGFQMVLMILVLVLAAAALVVLFRRMPRLDEKQRFGRKLVETAVQAGCTVVAISDRYTVEDEPALRKLADRYIYNFTELL